MMKLCTLVVLVSLTTTELNNLTAQQTQRTISGTVTSVDKKPIPGVTVIVKGTTNGTNTDIDGKFTLSVPNTANLLVFSFIGMESKEITIGTDVVYNVILVEKTVGLEEVVIVGYGTQKKESVVGAVTQMDNAALIKSGTSNVTNTIAGQLSGVLTIQQVGEPGRDNSEIIIRSVSSWNGSQPLILVDGLERDFTNLNPNEINTISVLKDASATEVFGAKGANGVIIVTTKRDLLGKPKMDFSASYGLEKATRIPDHLDSFTTMSLLNVAYMNGQQFTLLTPKSILKKYCILSRGVEGVRSAVLLDQHLL
jgi:TonB-dependent SusC/RagA subfamily outer membrane receptor